MNPAPRRILILKPSSLGDVIHALPALHALRRAWPQAHVAWMIGSSFAPVLQGHPQIDELICFDRRRYGAMWRSPAAAAAFWRFVADVRRRRFDLVIDLQGLIRSGLIAFFSGARHRFGFADARELAWLFYTTRVATPAGPVHAVRKNLLMMRSLGVDTGPDESPGGSATGGAPLPIDDDDRAAAAAALAQAGVSAMNDFVAVFVGARWESKLWPTERFAGLIDLLRESGGPPPVLLGAPDETGRADEISAACRVAPANLVGKTTLRSLAALIERARLVISLDSGPLHLAAALGRPTIAMFGPTDPNRTGPWSARARVMTHPTPCAPCLRRRCPLSHHDCLRKLEEIAVLAAVREVLRESARPSPGGNF